MATNDEGRLHEAKNVSTLRPMSAKKNSKSRANAPMPASAAANKPAVAATSAAGDATADAPPAWIDSPDPRKRTIGKIVLVVVWIYVAALWLLALDQTFHWGIFGPKIPIVP
jgi:hypothetical protein